jgi:zinc/manganese transport system substrate-binding protein
MRRRLIAAAALAFAAGPLASPTPAAADELRIVAATTDIGALARAVGGDRVRIDVVARPDRDLHTLEVRPSAIRKVAKADFYLEAGLALDLWSVDIVRGSRNRDLRVVDCGSVIEPLEVPEGPIDASMGDVHPEGNPHWWLDPLRAVQVARALAAEFGRADPEHAADYGAGANAFAAEVDRRLPGWKAALAGRSFVEYHASWVYLAERFGMEIAGKVEPLPGIPPTARHLATLAELIRSRHVPVVIRDVHHPGDAVDFLVRETGVRGLVLPASCDEPTPASYFAHLDQVAAGLGGE